MHADKHVALQASDKQKLKIESACPTLEGASKRAFNTRVICPFRGSMAGPKCRAVAAASPTSQSKVVSCTCCQHQSISLLQPHVRCYLMLGVILQLIIVETCNNGPAHACTENKFSTDYVVFST